MSLSIYVHIAWHILVQMPYLVRNQFYAVASSSHMSNNKLKSTAHGIVQGMSSSLLVVHQYTHAWITLTLCIVLRKFDANSFEMSSLIIQHRCTCFCTHIPHKVLWIQYCQLLSSFIQSVFILTDYPCLPQDARQTIQLSRDACTKQTYFLRKLFMSCVCSNNILPQYQSLSQSLQDITAQEAKVTWLNNHRPSSNLDIFSFSHTSYQSRSWYSVFHSLYVLVMDVLLSVTA